MIGANSTLKGRALSMSGAITSLENLTVTIPLVSIVNDNQNICFANSPEDIILAPTINPIIKWQKSLDITFSYPTDIISTENILPGNLIGNTIDNIWIRAVFQDKYSEVATITVGEFTTWNGTSWSGGLPDNTKTAIFE